MNITNITHKGFNARFLAAATIFSLLLSALPVSFFVANAISVAPTPVTIDICHMPGAVEILTDLPPEAWNGHSGHAGDYIIETDEDRELCVGPLTGSISGVKFNDVNNSGTSKENDEAALSGWTIRLYEAGDPWTLVTSLETDSNGEYKFTGITEGEYKVCEVMQDDWTQTFVSNGSTNGSPNSTEEGPECRTVNINSNGETNTVNFGNHYVEAAIPDVCSNIEGDQLTLPEGYEFVGEGDCAPIQEEPVAPTVCSYKGSVISYSDPVYKNNNNPVDANRRHIPAVEAGVAPYANFFGQEANNWTVSPLDFFSLGIEGWLVYEFTDKVAIDAVGDDIAVWEISGGNPSHQSSEKTQVWLSEDGINFELAETITGDGGVDIADTSLSFVKFVKLVDTSVGVQGGNGDGFDVDAIAIINDSCAEQKADEVTICKYDANKTALSGWQLSLLGEKVDEITVQPDGTTQSLTGVADGEYVLKADGTYQYRGSSGLLADSRFSERKIGDPGYGTYPYQPWREASNTTGGLALQVNGDLGALWGSIYSPAHVYYGSLTQVVTGDVDFYVYDNAYTDNVGEIDVELYAGRTGITGENGCVTFTDVPYGEYDIEELLQVDWENLSGLGTVVVDEEVETFSVVNRDTTVVEPVLCHLPYLVTFGSDSDDSSYSTSAGTGLVIEEITNGYKIGLYDDGRAGVYSVNGTITFPVGTDTSIFAFSEEPGSEGLEQTGANYPDVANRIGNNIEFDLYVNGANDIFSIVDQTLETENNCSIPTPEPEPEFGPYCGDGEVNQLWEQCDGADGVFEGESCTNYCFLDNQCSEEQLVKITLDDTDSTSFDGSLHLDMAGNTIPNGAWFSFGESAGNDNFATIAGAIDGLAIKRDTANSKLALAFTGGNSRSKLDLVQGTIETMGIDLGSVDRKPDPNPSTKYVLENVGQGFVDIFDKNIEDTSVVFDLRADTGNDGVTVEIGQGDEYGYCPQCHATVEARVVLNDSGTGTAGNGDLSDEIILGDAGYTTVEFGEWFPISEAPGVGLSAVMVNDPNTVTNFATPASKPGLFVSRENGTVKVALYGKMSPGGNVNHEWIDARIEIRDAGITNFAELTGDYKLETHPTNQSVPSNNGFDTAVPNSTGVNFKLWVDTASDGFKFDVDTETILACEDDTVDTEPVPDTYRIDGYKYEMEGDVSVPLAGWTIQLRNSDGGVSMSTTTDESGYFWFENLAPGYHEVHEVMISDWTQVEVRRDGDLIETDLAVEFCEMNIPNEYDYQCDFYNEYTEPVDETEEPPVITTSGGSSSSGGRPRLSIATPTPLVLGAATSQCPFLVDYMQMGTTNDTWQVMKLQLFLNAFKSTYGGVENPITGVFGQITDANVKAFQNHYRAEILNPWFERGIVPHNRATGFVYKTTLWKINSIVCPEVAELPNLDGEDLNSNVDID